MCSGRVSIEVKVNEGIGIGRWSVRTGGNRQSFAELFRQRRPEFDRGTRDRVPKDEPGRMQKVPARRKSDQLASPSTAVGVVADDRMSDRRQVHPDLMCASRMEMRPQQVDGIEARKPSQICPSRPTSIDDCHACSVSWISRYGPVDREAILSQVSP